MLRELIHLARHAPSVLALQQKLDQTDLYDTLMKRADDAGMYARRRSLVSDLRGDVLEIGCGTGMMFEHYSPGPALRADGCAGAHVRAVDMDDAFIERAKARLRDGIELVKADAQALPFPDDSFDAAVACLVFCSIPDAGAALAEARRVLRPGGEQRLIEHVDSERPVARALMHAADPIWLRLNHQGCHMDRDTLRTAREFFPNAEVTERFQLYSAGLPAFPMVTLRASK